MRLALILLFSGLLPAQTNSAILALAGLGLAAPGTRAQSQAPAFEVASVKVVDDGKCGGKCGDPVTGFPAACRISQPAGAQAARFL